MEREFAPHSSPSSVINNITSWLRINSNILTATPTMRITFHIKDEHVAGEITLFPPKVKNE